MICHQHRYIFVHIPKTAGVNIYHRLGKTDEQNHKTRRDYRAPYFSFAFVRNPWDRLVSAYEYMRAGGRGNAGDLFAQDVLAEYADFEDFVLSLDTVAARLAGFPAAGNGRIIKGYPHLLPQYRWITRFRRLNVDFVGRFETLEQDLQHVAQRIGIALRAPPPEPINASARAPYPDYYDGRTRRLVARFYRRDLQLFGYRFGE